MGLAEAWPRWSARPLGGAVCRDHVQPLLLLLAPQKWQFGFLYLIVHNLCSLCLHACYF